jgi:hypothetical protein
VFDRVVRAMRAKHSITYSWVVRRWVCCLSIQFLLGLELRNRASEPFQLAAIQGPGQRSTNQATKTVPAPQFDRGLEGL